jgi:hypothetical protein
MTRLMRPAHPVEVRRRDDAPEQFLWRGRLYVVRAVLARWTESGGWWRTPAVRRLVTGEGAVSAAVVGPASIDDREREWWRVEADSGRLAALSAGPGVYDLCFDWSEGAWSLARVLD